MQKDPQTERIIGCCFKVHSELGPGFPEKIYHNALEKALAKTGISFVSEKNFRVAFQGESVGSFKVDLLVEERVIVEVKAVSGVIPKIFAAQVLAYLKAARLPVGLLVNFGNTNCQISRFVL